MKAKHAEKRPKITISLWLFIAIIAFLVLLIIGITFYSVQRELNSDNKNNNTTIAATEQTTAAETTQAVTEETTEQSIQKTTEESTEKEEAAVEPTTQAIVVSGAESADKNLNFDAEMYPYKAFDNVGKRDASVKEVFGSVYGGEGITFDKNGLFSDNITQSEYNYGAYTVTDGVINMTYSNDKNKSAEIISYKGNVPSEIKIDYVGYDVYFKTGEHDFQYLKFTDSDIRNEILNCSNPYDARNIGRKYKSERISNWSEVKYELLEKVFRLKMEQNPIVRECLLNTLDYTICEYCVDEDTEWGLDRNNNGENKLGKAWMKVREGLK